MNPMKSLVLSLLVFGTASVQAAPAADPAFDSELLSIQQAWAKVNYDTPAGDVRVQSCRN